MPSYREQIPDDAFNVSFMIVPDSEDDSATSFNFQEQEQVKVGGSATQQGGCGPKARFLLVYLLRLYK